MRSLHVNGTRCNSTYPLSCLHLCQASHSQYRSVDPGALRRRGGVCGAGEGSDSGVRALPEAEGQVGVVEEGVHGCRFELAVDVVSARLHVSRQRGNERGGDALAQGREGRVSGRVEG
jgi:hypothetical protein